MKPKDESKPPYEALEKRVAELEQRNNFLEDENNVLREQSVRDGKTGLYNANFYNRNIADIVGRSSQKEEGIGIVFIDMNKLKYLNDNFGHKEGDRVMRDLARIMESSVKSIDYVIRWGGDEFVILLSNADGSTGKSVIDRITDKIAKYNEHNRIESKDKKGNPISYELSVSCGYELRAHTSTEPMDDIIDRSDKLMYRQKHGTDKKSD
ncbi:GGDEF domain-containing protein [Candidatus Woesearchaeota archaeon]|nr:GGDEF domain-containing protein [Candidatus Woesearchaeota archaeon]